MEINGPLTVKGAPVPETRNVLSYGATGDGSTDDYAAILAAYNSLPTNGGIIYFPSGTYLISQTLNILRSNITLVGEGPSATELHASGDFSAIFFDGVSEAGTLNRGGAREMTIRGGGKTNTSAYGIQTDFSNRIIFSNLVFFSCYHAFDIKDAFLVAIRDCSIYGAGTDQNHIGLYGQVSTNSDSNNIVAVDNLNVQGTVSHGVRMESFAGSKFVNCEVGSAGGKGWYFGAPQSGGPYLSFLHIANCLADTCTEEGWFFDGTGGYGNYIADIQLSNIWAGTCSEGIHIEDAYNFTISNILVETTTEWGVYVGDSARIDFHGGYMDEYDSGNTSTYSGFYLQDASKCLVSEFNFQATAAESAIREAQSSNINRVLGNYVADGGGLNLIGLDTIESDNIT